MPNVHPRQLTAMAAAILTAAGATPENSACVASSLVGANLAGHDSHGVMRLPSYVRAIRSGRLRPAAAPFIVRENAVTAVVDGDGTFGQVAARFAADLAIPKAHRVGLAAVATADCHHTGRLGEWVERIGAEGLIAMAMGGEAQPPHRVAPYGGATGALATNPIAWAVPRRQGQPPVLLDYATSAAAIGKLAVARARGEAVPEGWILDAAGRPTTEPESFFAGGVLLPFGGHKGYALAVIVELLAVGLSSGDRAPAARRSSCLYLLAIDPTWFRPRDEFEALVEAALARLLEVPPAGPAAVLVPGAPEARAREEREHGIPIPEPTWLALEDTARELNVPCR